MNFIGGVTELISLNAIVQFPFALYHFDIRPVRTSQPAGPAGSALPGPLGPEEVCWPRRSYRVQRGQGPGVRALLTSPSSLSPGRLERSIAGSPSRAEQLSWLVLCSSRAASPRSDSGNGNCHRRSRLGSQRMTTSTPGRDGHRA
jgi:hypothetical protein